MAQLSRYHRIYKFPNGATLIYYKQNVNNTTKFLAGYLGGASQDKIPGTAHFTEHMLHKECPGVTKEYIAQLTKDCDVDSNAFTSSQYIMLYGDVPNSNLDKILELNSKLLFNTKFNPKSIDMERMAIDEEINLTADEEGGGEKLAGERVHGSLLDDTIETITVNTKPEDFSILGTHEDIAKINKDVIKEYVDRVFVAENMVLTVVSNLEFEEIKEKMDKYFASKAKSDKTKRVRFEKTKYYPPSNYVIKEKNPAQKTVEVAVSFMSRKPEKETRLYSYVEDYLLNGFGGKLLDEIRRKRGLAYAAQFVPMVLPNNMSLNTIYVTTSKDKVNETIETVGKIIKDVAQNGITEEQLTSCKNMIITREKDRKNNSKTIDPFLIMSRYLEGTEVFFNNQIHRVKELSLDTVNKYLTDTYTNANIFATVKGDIPDDCYTPYQIQKLLNARHAQVQCSMIDGKYYDFETGKRITQKRAFEITNGVDKNEKLSNMAFVYDNTVGGATVVMDKSAIQGILDQFTVEQKVTVTNELLKSLGVDFAVRLMSEEEQSTGENVEEADPEDIEEVGDDIDNADGEMEEGDYTGDPCEELSK